MIEVGKTKTGWFWVAGMAVIMASAQPTARAEDETPAPQAEGVVVCQNDSTPAASLVETPPPQENPAAGTQDLPLAAPKSDYGWVIDYRFRSLVNSQTSYEVGTHAEPPAGWTPLSMLRFPLDSSWNGLQVGVEKPNWNIHVEWLTPMSQNIQGDLADYDWQQQLRSFDGSFTDLGYAKERWTDGQMLTLDMEYKESDRFLGLPIELWPIGGFRWQRFGLTDYDLTQVKEDNVWKPYSIPGDVITFNQQYYIGYVGGQLRKTLPVGSTEIRMTFQGDWGYTWGYSIDHHLLGDFYGVLASQGSSWHIAFIAEVPLSQHWSLGGQVDYMEIRATGKDWEWNRYGPGPRTNGVCAYSDQTSLTAFLRLHY